MNIVASSGPAIPKITGIQKDSHVFIEHDEVNRVNTTFRLF